MSIAIINRQKPVELLANQLAVIVVRPQAMFPIRVVLFHRLVERLILWRYVAVFPRLVDDSWNAGHAVILTTALGKQAIDTSKTALVCGAGGFIGSHLVRRLKDEGFWV